MKMTTVDGHVIEGNAKEIAKMLKDGVPQPSGTYVSSERGVLHIEAMNTNHIGNALKKKMRAWVKGLKDTHGMDLVNALQAGAPTEDSEFIDLLEGLVAKAKEEALEEEMAY